MTRLAMVDPENEPAELRPVFDQLRRTRGRVPGMYRTLAHQPQVLAAHRAYFSAALDNGILSRAFKEHIAYRVARMRGSAYSSASHRRYALDHGITEAQLAAIDQSDFSSLPEDLRVALTFTEAMVRSHGHVSETQFARLSACFEPAAIVEIVTLIGIMELASNLGAVFGLEPD